MIECEVFFYQGSATYKQRPIYTYLYKKYLLGKYILYCTLYRIKKMWMFLSQCIFLSRRCYFKAMSTIKQSIVLNKGCSLMKRESVTYQQVC